MIHSYVGHDSFICGTRFIHMWDTIHSYVGHDSFICGTRSIHLWDMIYSCVGHGSFICGTWFIHICGTRLVHMWDMDPSYVGHGSFICGTWILHIWDMVDSYAEYGLIKLIYGTWFIVCDTQVVYTHLNELCFTYNESWIVIHYIWNIYMKYL